MSINTLVLTSIKVEHVIYHKSTLQLYLVNRMVVLMQVPLPLLQGTPLYMSPELVQEKPYDHNSDLWFVITVIKCEGKSVTIDAVMYVVAENEFQAISQGG